MYWGPPCRSTWKGTSGSGFLLLGCVLEDGVVPCDSLLRSYVRKESVVGKSEKRS